MSRVTQYINEHLGDKTNVKLEGMETDEMAVAKLLVLVWNKVDALELRLDDLEENLT